MKKSTGSIDKEIGSACACAAVSIGMSQEKLGEMLGLTFQQVQKYEKGTNRISVGRLVDIAKILGVDIHFFFDGIAGVKPTPASPKPAQPPIRSDLMSTPEGLQLMRHLPGSRIPKSARASSSLVASLVEEGTERST